MISLARYAAVLQARETRLTFAFSVLGRLPIGITGLAILLLVQSRTGSFAQGGSTTAGYVVGLACLAPALGRWIDRRGPRHVLMACGLLFPGALVALVAAVSSGAPGTVTLLLAAAAGASFPPITVCMRTYFRQRLADDALLAAAYSLESVLIELIFIVGPMLVAGFVAFASPAAAVWFAASCGGVGALLFARSPALRAWRIGPARDASLLGPLANRRFVALIAVVLCYSAAFGLVEIGIAAYAIEAGDAALAGVLLGLMSAGSALGGLAYGSRSWHTPLARQFALTLAIMGGGLALLALPWGPWPFSFLCAAAGVIMAPALIIQSILVTKTARAEHSTEAFTWSTSALLGGVGIGLAAGGGLLEVWPAAGALACAGAAAFIAALAARVTLAASAGAP
ncbi:MAG: MFS transporter [Betaproteobacteria bacterium]